MQTVEAEKLRKYDLLANVEIYKCKVRVIPYVLTWDGLVTKCHTSYCKQLEVEKYIKAYIQSVVLKRTFESISLDSRRTDTRDNSRDIMISAAVEGLWRDEDEREQTQDSEA